MMIDLACARRLLVFATLALATTVPAAAAVPPASPAPLSTPAAPRSADDAFQILAQRWTCRMARSCREAVIRWCGGYRRADGDGDGIPCENVCRSRREVDAIRREIGC